MKPSEKLLNTIQERKIRPVPKFIVVCKSTLIWVIFALAVLLGMAAFSVILFSVQQTDFDLISHMKHSSLEFILALLPISWLSMLILFVITAIISAQYAPRVYKLTVLRMGAYSAALSILLGTIYFLLGGASQLESAFSIRISLYESIQQRKVRMWSMPDQGFLCGQIIDSGDDTIHLLDFRNKKWKILYSQAFISPAVDLQPGDTIKLNGSLSADTVFQASAIRPWGGLGMNKKGPSHMNKLHSRGAQ